MRITTVPILALLLLAGCHCRQNDLPLSSVFCHEDESHGSPTPAPCVHHGCGGADLDCSGRVDGYDAAIATKDASLKEQLAVSRHFGQRCDDGE